MTFSTKVDGEWKEIKSLYCKVNGKWKSIYELFAKEDGVWVTVFAGGAWVVFNKYPHPIPVATDWRYRVEGGNWVKVTEDGEINTDGGTFTGVVKVRGVLTLDEWFSDEIIDFNEAVRIDGTPLSVPRHNSTQFVNGDYGYVCGGYKGNDTSSIYTSDTVDVYDSSGNRTTGNSIIIPVEYASSFVNSERGYVCGGRYYAGGDYHAYPNVSVYDISGNRTTGTDLSEERCGSAAFTIGEKGYVCGGVYYDDDENYYHSIVDVYDSSGNRTTGTSLSLAGIGYGRVPSAWFTNGDYGYVCGGSYDSYTNALTNLVDVYDISGNRTTGTPLSTIQRDGTAFTNGNYGYVCGGSNDIPATLNNVDIYDIHGVKTIGTPMSEAKQYATSFAYNEKGFVCGGWYKPGASSYQSDVVIMFDINGVQSLAKPLSCTAAYPESFAFEDSGFVFIGGYYNNNLNIYYDEEIITYEAKIPITAGTSYTLNGISGTAPTSEVLTFGEKVSGTIRYQSGVLPRCALIYNKSLASDPSGCLEYTSVSKGYIPMSGASGSANEGSWASGTIFDEIEVGYLNGSTWVADSKAAMTGSTSYNCFTRIPKIYQRITQIDDNKIELAMDTKPFEGATLHPAFVMDGVEVNYKYIGRFLGRNVNSVLTSTSGGQPTHTLTRAEFRTLAKANGSSYGLMSYYDWDLVNKLFLFAFKSFDSQTALGKGWTGKDTYRNCGSSNGYSWNCGWQDATTVMSFIGIEDWWGNTFQFIDNFLTDASYIYASQSSNPTDNVADMTAICPNPSTLTGIPMTCRGGLNDFFISASIGGSETTGLCDQQYYDAEVNGGRVGAYYASANAGGAFYLNAQNSISSSGATAGARLVHWE